MGTIRTTFAAVLAALALTAFQSDAFAQTRRESRSSSSTSRSASSTNRKSTAARPASQTRQTSSVRSSAPARQTSATRQTSTARPSTSADRKPSSATRPSSNTGRKPSTAARPSTGSERKPAATRPAARPSERPTTARPATRPSDKPTAGRPVAKPADRPVARPRPGGHDKPMQQIRPDHKPDPHRKHPRDRDFMPYHNPSHYWAHHNHCFGYRVRVLPAHCVRHYYHGHVYYCYNDIWYRPYGGYYVVCRPPFGTVLTAAVIADMTWNAVSYSYYNTVQQTYDQINENNQYIAEQNALIAQNNATLAAQNQALAMNQQLASQAYILANELGLVQSYAAANGSYYYQDGIFYVMDTKGEYKTIIPPAGALVETLPDDYDMVTLKGNEYYKVDDTVYKVTISEGKPYFEVLGQLYN